MSAKTYAIFAKNGSDGTGITGLTLSWVDSTVYNTDSGATVTAPVFSEIGSGFYSFPYDSAANGSMCGTIDLSAGGPSGAGRYLRAVISCCDASIMPVLSDRMATAAAGAGTGTVTSVALAEDATASIFTFSAAVTTSGTITITKRTQAANLVWSGPTTGAAAEPTFRALVTADMPASVALLASPTFTGTPTLPTGTIATTQAVGTSGTSLATTAFVANTLSSSSIVAYSLYGGF